jgi:hypothetical protein
MMTFFFFFESKKIWERCASMASARANAGSAEGVASALMGSSAAGALRVEVQEYALMEKTGDIAKFV